jgi:crotonobetainyl-CoA:carnitine CoA-transferase CaiB-like acyl-CoA transferase
MVSTVSGLSDVRVIDLTQEVAGPYATCLLGGFGADVIKVEPPGAGDPTRGRGPFPNDEPNPEKSAPFLYLNRNKRGVTLNLRTETGKQLLLALVEIADAVVESFEPGTLESLGLGHEALKGRNPSLVVTSVTNFGQTGPYRRFKGGELVLDALGGWIFLTGFPEREPVKPGLFQAQYSAGLNAAIHTLAALNVRQALGQGRSIDVSIMETAVHFVGSSISTYSSGGDTQVRAGSWTGMMKGWAGPRSHPTEIYECKDGHVGVAVQTQGQWEMFALVLDIPALKEDPRFATGYSERGRYARELNEVVAPWFMERTRREIFDILGEYRIPCGMAYTAEEILSDPQHEAVGFFKELEQADGSALPFPSPPLHGADLAWRMERAPGLGEHNAAVYSGLLGYSKKDVAGLRNKGVI